MKNPEFQDELVRLIRLVRLESPKNAVYLSIEGKAYVEHHIITIFHKNHKTLNYEIDLSDMVITGTEMLENGECVVFDRKGNSHALVFEDYEKHILDKHYN